MQQSVEAVRSQAVYDSVEWLVEAQLAEPQRARCECEDAAREAERGATWWHTLQSCGFRTHAGLEQARAQQILQQCATRCRLLGVELARATDTCVQVQVTVRAVAVMYGRAVDDKVDLLYSFFHTERVLHFSPNDDSGCENSPAPKLTLVELLRPDVLE